MAEDYIRCVSGQQFIVRRGKSGDAVGWIVRDIVTRDVLSGAHLTLTEAFEDCKRLAGPS